MNNIYIYIHTVDVLNILESLFTREGKIIQQIDRPYENMKPSFLFFHIEVLFFFFLFFLVFQKLPLYM